MFLRGYSIWKESSNFGLTCKYILGKEEEEKCGVGHLKLNFTMDFNLK